FGIMFLVFLSRSAISEDSLKCNSGKWGFSVPPGQSQKQVLADLARDTNMIVMWENGCPNNRCGKISITITKANATPVTEDLPPKVSIARTGKKLEMQVTADATATPSFPPYGCIGVAK